MKNNKIALTIAALAVLIFVGLTITKYPFKKLSNEENATINDSSPVSCPYYVNKDFSKEYFSNIFNEIMVTYPPALIASNENTTPLKEKFNSNKPPFESEFYTISKGAYPWTERKFDVDNDQKDERILSANTAMNHTPNLALIVKDGYTIFKAEGANIVIEKVGDHKGFFLSEAVDWNTGEYKTTRYIYQDGKFIPVWFQTSCVVRPLGD